LYQTVVFQQFLTFMWYILSDSAMSHHPSMESLFLEITARNKNCQNFPFKCQQCLH